MPRRKYHSITPQAIIDANLLLIYVNTVKTVIPNIEIINNQYKSMLYYKFKTPIIINST